MSLITNRRDLDFLLYEVEALEALLEDERYEAYDRVGITAVLDTAQGIAEQYYLSCAAKLDANEPTFDGESVHIIPEVGEALTAYREAGFFSAGFDEAIGGLQLPTMVTNAVSGIFSAANIGLANYHFLTIAAASMLAELGTEEQKDTYLTPMLEGRWFGTMCLSEPQAGSSLSDIATRATPAEGGHYLVVGSKMWISGGEQEISENIVHMVLAKISGAPPGVKGLSLFIVPKYRVNPDGSSGGRNNITLGGLNHKMGQRGTTNTLLNFGESGECHGYLVGELHQGLKYMFHMMNEARIGVGLGAAMSGLAGYLYALQYAKERPQGRAPENKNPEAPQVPIIQHTDVKRLLLAQKAYVEGAMGLLLFCSYMIDVQKTAPDPEEREDAGLLLDILTPIAKSWPSEFCLEANKHAIQILGGYGYTKEYPVERHYRDNRLNPIHEGAHGIQGLDLLGRKVSIHNGKALELLVQRILADCELSESGGALSEWADALREAVKWLELATETILACDKMNLRLANATLYLDTMGHIVIAWMWLRQAKAAASGVESATGAQAAFYRGKLMACRYFFTYELPYARAQLEILQSLDETCLTMNSNEFIGEV